MNVGICLAWVAFFGPAHVVADSAQTSDGVLRHIFVVQYFHGLSPFCQIILYLPPIPELDSIGLDKINTKLVAIFSHGAGSAFGEAIWFFGIDGNANGYFPAIVAQVVDDLVA